MLQPGNIVVSSTGGQFAVPMIVKSVADGRCLCYWIDSKSFTINSCYMNEDQLVLLCDKLKDAIALEEIEGDEIKNRCKNCGGTGFIKVKSGKIVDKWPCPECKDD